MSGRGAIATLLADAGYGTIAETIWVGDLPAGTEYPAINVSVYDGVVIDTYTTAEQQQMIQVYITGTPQDDEECEALADAIWATLAEAGSFVLDGTAINAVRLTTVPLDLGVDGSDRPMRSINMEVTYE